MSRWFRYYEEALDDPKVQMLPPPLFKAWINLLCLASRHRGVLPGLNAIAFALRLEGDEVASNTLAALSERGLIDRDGETFTPHNWNGRQFKSDVSTDRVKQHRQRSRNVSGDDEETEGETAPEAEQSTEQNPPIVPPKKIHEDFEVFKAAYPKRAGSNPWEPAKQKFLRAVRDGYTKPEIIIGAARRYAAEQEKLGKVGTEFIMQAKAWLNQKCWQDYAADQFGDANDMVRKSDPRWQFLTARWERENSQTFPKFADKWPFPAAWLIDANNPEWPDAPAFLVRTA